MGLDAVRNVKINFIAEDQSVGSTVDSIKGQLVAVAAVAAAAGVAVKFMGDETARLDTIAKDAKKSGLGFTAYQQLQQVAKLAGSDIGSLAKATVRLNRNLLEIGRGSGEIASAALEKLRITTADLAGKTDTERLGVLGDALNKIERGSTRAALAQDLMGKSGSSLLPLLQEGSAGIDKMVNSVGKLFTAEELAKAEAYQDALANLEKAANDAKGELVVGLAPVFTEVADSMRESGQTAAEVMPVIVKSLENVADAGAVLIDAMALSAEVIGAIGRVADFAGTRLGRLADTAGDAADGVLEFISESRVGDWARDAAAGVSELTGGADGLTQSLRDQSPIVEELGQTYDELARAITGAEIAASKLSLIGDAKAAIKTVIGLGKAFDDQREEAIAATDARAGELVAQAEQSEFLAKLGAVEGEGQKLINEQIVSGLELRKQAAQLQFDQTASTKDEAKLLAATRNLQLAQAAKIGGGGGVRVSRAQRLVALGEQSVSLLEQEARISALLADDADEQAAASQQALDARRERLLLERQGLEITKARGEFARQELENKLAAKDAELEAVDVQQLIEAREREREVIADVFSIEQARSLAEANAASQRFELLGREFEAREVLRAQQEQALLANPPEDELGRIERLDTLQRIAFDREMDRRQQSSDAVEARAALEEKLHADELRRIKEKQKKQKAAIDATSRFLSTGQQFASAVINASIKDEDKRASAELKARGIMAIATGALEVVRAVAAAASFNPVQAALHGAAAAVAFATGTTMLAGGLPSRGTPSAGGASAAATADRDTSEAARTVESVPAVDGEPARQPSDRQRGAGGTTIIFEDGAVRGLEPTDETFEKIRIQLDNVNNALEEAG